MVRAVNVPRLRFTQFCASSSRAMLSPPPDTAIARCGFFSKGPARPIRRVNSPAVSVAGTALLVEEALHALFFRFRLGGGIGRGFLEVLDDFMQHGTGLFLAFERIER